MAGLNFEVTKHGKIAIANFVYAEIKDLGWKMKLYLDIDTGDVLYPVTIEKLIPGITIVIDSSGMASCSLPPSILESEVDGIRDCLGTVHEVIAAVHKLIKEELEK